MKIQENTAELWDRVWDKPSTVEKDLYTVAKEERLIRWQRMEAMVRERFHRFEGLSVIEIGAGRGTNAALMAQRGAQVTVLDYSDSALERAKRLFDALALDVELVNDDALDLPDSLRDRFDVSMSFGLAEHFLDERRSGILKAHFDVLNEHGLTFISVPNSRNPPYRLYKWITERTGAWGVGEEYPFTREELENYCAELGVKEFGFFGDSLWRSKRFLNPIKWVPRRKRRASVAKPTPAASRPDAGQAPATGNTAQPSGQSKKRYHRRLPGWESGTSLDAHYSYALVLWGIKATGSPDSSRALSATQATSR